MTLHTAELDGRKIAYSSETVFRVQVGRGRGAYRDRYRVVGDLAQAVLLYNSINCRAPYKARLYSDFMRPRPTLARKVGL